MDEDQEVVIVGPDGTEHVFPAGFDPRRAAAIVRNNGSSALPSKPVSAEDFTDPAPSSGWPAKLGDFARGFAKSAAHTALDLGEAAGHLRNPFNPAGGTLSEAVDTLYGTPGLSETAFPAAREATAYRDPSSYTDAEHLGAGLETLAETAAPVWKSVKAGIDAVPTIAKAGAKFERVMGAARNIPVDVTEPGNVALRIQELADRGASMPMAVRKFLNRVTDPDKAALTYEEARDFASNISRLSAQEYQKLAPSVGREVAGLRVALNKAVGEAAGKAGKGIEYAQAMNEYARAKQLRGMYEAFVDGAKKGAPWATAAAAGGFLGRQLHRLLGE